MGYPEAEIQRYISEREAQLQAAYQDDAPLHPQINLHPENIAVFNSLLLVSGCFNVGASINGFRFSDAETVMDWHDVDKPTKKRLVIAVNAILQG